MSPSPDERARERPPFTDTLYANLCGIAEAALRRSRPDTVILPAELVHECFLKLEGADGIELESSLSFRALAAAVIRQVLVDRVRARQALKRGGAWQRVSLQEGVVPDEAERVDLLALDEALERLAALDVRQARIVELRFFGGLTIPEVADALRIAPRTVDEDWKLARAWLRRACS